MTSSAMLVICRSLSGWNAFYEVLVLICLLLFSCFFGFDRSSFSTSRIIAFASRLRRSHNGSQRLGGTPGHNFSFGTATTSCPFACRFIRWWWCGCCCSRAFAALLKRWGCRRRHRNWTATKKRKKIVQSKSKRKEIKMVLSKHDE